MEQDINEKLEAIEKQLYIVYLQLNAVTKMLIEGKIIEQGALVSEMEKLNEEVYKVTKEVTEKMDQELQKEATTEVTSGEVEATGSDTPATA